MKRHLFPFSVEEDGALNSWFLFSCLFVGFSSHEQLVHDFLRQCYLMPIKMGEPIKMEASVL